MNIRYRQGIHTNAGKALIQIKSFKSFFKWHKFKIARGTRPRTEAEQPSEIRDCHGIPYNKEVSTGQRPHYTPFPFHSLDTHLIVVVFPWLWVCLSVFSVGSFALQSWKIQDSCLTLFWHKEVIIHTLTQLSQTMLPINRTVYWESEASHISPVERKTPMILPKLPGF